MSMVFVYTSRPNSYWIYAPSPPITYRPACRGAEQRKVDQGTGPKQEADRDSYLRIHLGRFASRKCSPGLDQAPAQGMAGPRATRASTCGEPGYLFRPDP